MTSPPAPQAPRGAAADPLPAVTEQAAQGETARLFADIRATLGVDVVNLVWRHLATLPGALEWTWAGARPLYQGPAVSQARALRAELPLPSTPAFDRDALAAAGIDDGALAAIGAVLDSYQHTNALALVTLSALLAACVAGDGDTAPPPADRPATTASAPASRAAPASPLPPLPPLAALPPSLARLVTLLNEYGEDSDHALVASMYRHLSHWPAYLAMVQVMLAPMQHDGRLQAMVAETREAARRHGAALANGMAACAVTPPPDLPATLAAIRRFVEHPIARMVGICALMRAATPSPSASK